jgi:flagellar basal-body rod protein FlgC
MNSAGMAMVAQSHRMNAISSNIANMDTIASSPEQAFKAKLVVFKTVSVGGAQSVVVSDVVDSKAPSRPVYAPSHPLADDLGYIYTSNVNREEMAADMMSTEVSYELNSHLSSALKRMGEKTLQTLGGI